jgi:CRISPR/Cas system-associated protein endoribonuclease Cas2
VERDIENILPKKGKVEILHITDKQYEDIVSFYGHVTRSSEKILYPIGIILALCISCVQSNC